MIRYIVYTILTLILLLFLAPSSPVAAEPINLTPEPEPTGGTIPMPTPTPYLFYLPVVNGGGS